MPQHFLPNLISETHLGACLEAGRFRIFKRTLQRDLAAAIAWLRRQ
jgi:hypothetical protein